MNNLIPYYISEQYKKNNLKGLFKAYTMFVDISGFTKLTETLMKHKINGAEVLTDVLDIIFNPIVKNLYENGGIVTTYAGDAFTAIFKIDPGFKNKKINHGIMNSVLYINKYFKNNKIIETKYGKFETGVKVGLSYGEIAWGIIGKGGKNTYYFKGEAINGCVKSEHYAQKDEIILDDKIIKQLKIDKEHLIVKEEGYFKLKPKNIKIRSMEGKSIPHKVTKKDLQPFIFDSVINFKEKAEFRDIVSVFISFDESEKESVLNEFVIELIEESYNRGGYFNKIDFGDKGGVALVLFGAPISYENNIERALNFILQIKSSITKLKFRAGITYGTVYAGIMGGQERCEYTAIGDIVNLSARYMMKAEWNRYWISENIVKKVNKIYEFENTGKFEFKGKTGKIPVYELIKKKESREAVFFEGEIVGRKDELEQLGNFIKPIFNNKFAGIIYVYGEAGIGKSRLVWEFKKQVIDSLNWFYFPCEEILRKSFNPIIYFLKNYFCISEENRKEQNKQYFENQYNWLVSNLSLKKSTESLKEIITELERTKTIIGGYLGIEWKDSLYSQLDAKGRYENFIYAVKNMIKAESLIKPVIIELEDSHWIDSDSQKFIKILTRNIDNYPIILICASRYNDDGSEFELDLDKKIKVNKIDLNFLNKSNVSRYATIVLNTDKKLSKELLDFIYEKTNGNPFFTEQLLLDLKESNLIQINKENKLYSDKKEIKNIPSNIQAVVISRLDRLSDDIKQVVQTASVLGREFLIKILTNILKNEKGLYKKLYFIENEKIWSALSEIKYIFKHALLRDSAYYMQLRSRLIDLHKFAAKSYEEVFKDDIKRYYGDIAYHYQRAEIEDKAIEYLEKAGDYAKDNYQNEKALNFYISLIYNYQLSVINCIDILLKKSEILEHIGKWDESEKICKESLYKAEEICNKKYIAKCCNSLGWQLRIKGSYKESMKFIIKSLRLYNELGDKEGSSKAFGNMGAVFWNQGINQKAMECFEKDLAICEELGDKSGMSRAVGNMGLVCLQQGDFCKAMKCIEKSLTVYKELGDKRAIGTVVGNMGLVYKSQGDYSKAMECFDKSLEICKELGNKDGISRAIGNKGLLYCNQGDYSKAMECHEKSLAVYEEVGEKRAIGIVIGNKGLVYENQGYYDEAIEYYEKSLEICKELGNKDGICRVVGNMGLLYWQQGEYLKAMRYYEKHVAICEELGNAEYIFSSKILKEKIDFKLTSNTQKKIENIENFKSMLKDEKEEKNIAALNYEIALMLQELNKDSSKFKKRAIVIYKKLYKKTPKIEYNNRYEELEKLK